MVGARVSLVGGGNELAGSELDTLASQAEKESSLQQASPDDRRGSLLSEGAPPILAVVSQYYCKSLIAITLPFLSPPTPMSAFATLPAVEGSLNSPRMIALAPSFAAFFFNALIIFSSFANW